MMMVAPSSGQSSHGLAITPIIYSLFSRKVIERIQKSKASVVNITCPEIQNYTFTNEEPFDILGLPECGFSVELPELKLYLDDENKTECFLGLDHVQVFWKHKCFRNISQLESRPLIG